MIFKNKTTPVFIVAAFAVFLATFNETFMNVALSQMCEQLNVGFSTIQWLVTAYMLGAAIMVPVSAFMFRKVPTKTLFLCIIGCFVVGSLLGGLAGNNFLLVLLARIIQAIGSGMLVPVAMNIVLIIAPKQKLGSYMGVMGAMTTLGPSLSVILAGLLLTVSDFHILFWVFGALCLLCFILGAIFVGNVAKLDKPKLDILSVILISFALIGILFAISFVFSMWYIALIAFAVGIISLIWFVLRQKKLPDPLINLQPLKVKTFSISVVLNLLALIMVFAFNVILPQYLQSVTGVDALTASLTLFPAIFLCCIISPIAGKIYDKHGAKWLLIAGFGLMAIFAAMLALFISSPSIVLLGALYVPVIVGSAFIIGPVQSYGLSSLAPQQNPHGVTIFSTGFQIAGCIGASFFASAYAGMIADSADFVTASNNSFLITGMIIAGVAVVGLILSMILYSMRKKSNATQVQPREEKDISSVRDIMKQDIFSISQDATILDTLKFFVEKNISGCPIVDADNNLVGFISDGDIIRYLSTNHSVIKGIYTFEATDSEKNEFDNKLAELLKLNIQDVASKDAFWVDINDDLGEVCRVMAEMRKKKVPVLDNGKMVGIITRNDITRLAIEYSIKMANSTNIETA